MSTQSSTHNAPASSQAVSPLDAISLVLRSQNYYVAPLLQNEISPADIEAVSSAANNQFKVQIVALDKLPASSTAVSIAQKFESDAAQLQDNTYSVFGAKTPLIIVVAGNQIAARGAGLSPEELDVIGERAARVIDGGTYRAGLLQIVSTSAALKIKRQIRLWQMAGAAIILFVICVVIFARRRAARRKRKVQAEEFAVFDEQLTV